MIQVQLPSFSVKLINFGIRFLEFQSVYAKFIQMIDTTFSGIAVLFKEWVAAFIIIVLTFLVAETSRTVLIFLQKKKKSRVMSRLTPSIANLVYIIGLKAFIEVAPLAPRIDKWLDNSIYVLTIVLLFRFVQRAALLGLEWSSLRAQSSRTLHQGFIPLLKNMITLLIIFTCGIMILKHFNYDVMSLVTALGVGSLAVGLAAKDTLSNMISGFILIIDRNLKPGDRINLAGTVGDVKEIGLRSTQILIGDGNTLIVPNSDLVNTKLLNMSIPNRGIACNVMVRIPYQSDFLKVREIGLKLLKEIPKVSQNKAGWVNLISLLEGHQLVQLGFWVVDLNDTGGVISDVNDHLLKRLKDENIQPLSQFACSHSHIELTKKENEK